MTDRQAAIERAPAPVRHTLQWVNTEGAEIPAFAVIRLSAFSDITGQYTARKHDGSGLLTYVNGSAPIASGGYGGSMDWSASRLALVADGVSVGQEVGPVDDSWEMTEDGTGFVVFSNRSSATGAAAVIKLGGGGGEGGQVNIYKGIINESHGKGYYTVELAGWGGRTPRCFESITNQSDEEQDCDPCQQMVGFSTNSLDDNCGDITLPEFNAQHVGLVTKAYVLAYDPASTLVPLRGGSDCLLVDLGDSNPINDSNGMSGSSMEEEPVYQIIRGHQTHTVQYVDTYGCCGTGEDVLISRKAIIFAAVECDVAICNPCSDGGGGPS